MPRNPKTSPYAVLRTLRLLLTGEYTLEDLAARIKRDPRTAKDDGTVTIDRARYGGDFFPGVLPDHDEWETISIR